MTDTYVALLRGINVGHAGRLAMADLRAAVSDLGYGNVRTVLNSGNVVFEASQTTTLDAARRIEQALAETLGVPARVTVLTAEQLAIIVEENPLLERADNPSRLLVGFLASPEEGIRLEPLLDEDWSPEALAVGQRAAYLWCPAGVAASRLMQAVGRVLGDAVTMRNWTTVVRTRDLAGSGRD